MAQHDWNPELYLKFDKERIQPSIDLVSKIIYDKPDRIVDIGCGPGNSTQVLHQRWPSSDILGVDNSPAMIKKATNDYPNQKWLLADAGKDEITGQFDIVFSNATIQWIPNHEELIMRLSNILNDDGILAVQLPLFLDMPISKSINEIAGHPKWKSATEGLNELFTIHNVSFYYYHLMKYFQEVEIWTTDYYHTMDSHSAILEMMRPTGLKPYLEKIASDSDKLEFEALLLKKIENDYPVQRNDKVLFPFKRLFFIAKK
jgi:trans-aconitate 2-methyltransferase